MESILSQLLMAVPLLPLAAGLVSARRSPRTAGILVVTAASGALLVSLVLSAALVVHGGLKVRLLPWGQEPLSLGMDGVSATMAVLVSFLGLTVIRFSRNYLAGDPQQSRFYSWMSLTLASVLTLVLSGNLLLILAAWVAVSLFLHRLLLHFPQRAGAVFAARKKFVVSRLGDLCLLAAIVMVHRHYGTWELDRLFKSAADGNTDGLPVICLLLACCAALKSAQFPFHSWLPDTMETPTPVSAFMHAGIINAGGFLVVRLSPLFVHAPAALWFLAVVGSVTAAFGAVVMLAQPSVKRALAFSTIAQMGFMMLQCGVGAFGLALLHIVAHSLYKAHAFLHAGSSIGSVARTAVPLKTPALVSGLLVAAMLVAGGSTALKTLFPEGVLPMWILSLVIGLATAYGLARAWSSGGEARVVLRGTAVVAGVALLALVLHACVGYVFPSFSRVTPPTGVVVFVAAIFIGLFLFQALLWRTRTLPLGRTLYVHALNGFYVGTYANRLLSRLWPKNPSP